ncbi:hypothetical protein EON65_22010 [archaeon]|nr:MAG: hypothetical protein EON65_22010 [archaeon]
MTRRSSWPLRDICTLLVLMALLGTKNDLQANEIATIINTTLVVLPTMVRVKVITAMVTAELYR